MKGIISSLAFGATAVMASSIAERQSSVAPITVKGNAFFQGSNRFYIRGVDYQPGEPTTFKLHCVDIDADLSQVVHHS